jgi:hypothetical protein
MQTRHSLGVVFSSLVVVLAAGCGGNEVLFDEPIETKTGNILGGTDLTAAEAQSFGAVAIYHSSPGMTWFPRPCSGVVVKSSGTHSWVVTARHCVTVDNTIAGDTVAGGAIAPVSSFQLIRGAAPGIANPNPPAGGVQPAWAPTGMPVDLGTGNVQTSRDMAIIVVTADWRDTANDNKEALWVHDISLLINGPITSIGYGISNNDQNCHLPTSTFGAGTARKANFFIDGTVADNPGGLYVWDQSGVNGPKVMCGDSGGPDFVDLLGVRYFLGVHSTGVADRASSAFGGKWLSETVGGTVLTSDGFPGLDMQVGWDGTNPTMVTGGASTNVTYDVNSPFSWIKAAGNKCLQAAGGVGTKATFQPCNYQMAAQKWAYGGGRMLQNFSTGLCMTVSTALFSPKALNMTTCNGNDLKQRWAFRFQP